jgi:hypothetical protein
LDEEDQKKKEATKRKNKILSQIQTLAEKFEHFMKKNLEMDEYTRLT